MERVAAPTAVCANRSALELNEHKLLRFCLQKETQPNSAGPWLSSPSPHGDHGPRATPTSHLHLPWDHQTQGIERSTQHSASERTNRRHRRKESPTRIPPRWLRLSAAGRGSQAPGTATRLGPCSTAPSCELLHALTAARPLGQTRKGKELQRPAEGRAAGTDRSRGWRGYPAARAHSAEQNYAQEGQRNSFLCYWG